MADGKNILIEVNNLKKYFPVKTGFMKMNYVKAVDDVSFYIEPGGRERLRKDHAGAHDPAPARAHGGENHL